MCVRTLLTLIIFLAILSKNFYSQDLIQLKCVDTISVFFEKGNSKIKNEQLLNSKLNEIKLSNGTIRFKSFSDSLQNHANSNRISNKRYHEISALISKSNLKTLNLDTVNTLNQALYQKDLKQQINQVDILVYEYVSTIVFNKPIKSSISYSDGTSWMLPESKKEMNEILTLLKNDPNLKLTILSNYCCNMDHSVIISRAEKINKFLIEKGIDEKRITCAVFDKKMMEFYVKNGSIKNEKRQGIDLVFTN